MARWLADVVSRIRGFAAARKVLFTLKARQELASLKFGMDEEDACDVLANLAAKDSAGRLQSAETGEWMYLFKPDVGGTIVYAKLIVRSECIVVSFHEDDDRGHEQERA
jgi:hypothetical protein